MGEVYRERERERYRDYRDDPESDDERYRSVTRYKVPRGGGHDRAERVVDVDESGRSHFSNQGPRGSGDHLDVGGRDRGYAPDRPRSAFEPSYERERYYDREERSRVSGYGGSGYHDRDRGSDWDRRGRDDEVRVEKRTEERFDDSHGHEVERIRKETEYYAPQEQAGAPIVIRQRAEPQKIIVQEAPAAAPLVLTRAAREREYEGERQMARRDRERDRDDEYYSRYERREVGPYRGDPRDDDRAYAMARYDRDRERDRRREEDDYYVHRRKVVRRDSSASSEGHKRELAGGALAGAGITALLSSRRDADGDLPANRGKKVIAGAALGALGTEAIKRARSAYGERRGDRDGSPDDHSRLKKGLGIAAVALAAAGAAQYYKSNKVEKEESRRGRSRSRRHSHYDDHDRSLSRGGYYSRSVSRSVTPPRSKSRRRSLSKAAAGVLGTAAAAGVVKKLRDRSKSRARSASRASSGGRNRSRSKSRLRRAAEIGGVAATAGIASKMWKNHREKKAEDRDRERSQSRGYYSSADERDYARGRGGRRGYGSRSRSRSLVEYGDTPLPPNRGYEDEAEERRRRRRLRDRSHSSSASEPEKRSKSRLRNMAAAGAAAIGVKELMNRKDKDDDRRSRERESRERERVRRRSRRRSQARLYDDDLRDDDYFHDRDRRPAESPPMASGGAYYHPPYPGTPGPGPAAPGAPYAQFPNASQPNVNDYQPYVPQDYMGYPPAPAPGPPPPGPPGPPPPGPPPPGGNIPPAYVSDPAHGRESRNGDGNEAISELQSESRPGSSSPRPGASVASRAVTFTPLSPRSSQTMRRHLESQIEVTEDGTGSEDGEVAQQRDRLAEKDYTERRNPRRRSSDPSADRLALRRPRRRHESPISESEEDVEDLPHRFDSEGRRIDGRYNPSEQRWTSRRGEFRREPQRPGDWDVRGNWHVGGSDGITVDKLARSVTEALDGRRSWMGVLGGVLGDMGGGLLGQQGHQRLGEGRRDDDDSGYGSPRRKR